jgi:hypothetical protein
MSTAIVLRSHYPEPKQPKYRKSRSPIKSKIGDFVTTSDQLLSLVRNRRSVVVYDHMLLPAVNVIMWQFSTVIQLLNSNKIKEYLKT